MTSINSNVAASLQRQTSTAALSWPIAHQQDLPVAGVMGLDMQRAFSIPQSHFIRHDQPPGKV
ncbi:hypothetical protein [Pseudoxanthomonas dokdonensis]|uniref:hypothetical protein n=1 Tax=Pseudoxanthomonas dokdonensis TaxID=344882 RepID=UPI000AD9C828|nr:hypothetical protein [Pseudoxanthomonas dokdonensis]